MSLEQLDDIEITEPVAINPLQPGEEREDIQEMAAACEALLFVSAEPVPLGDLRRVLAIRQPTLERVLDYPGQDSRRGPTWCAPPASQRHSAACNRTRGCPLY